MEAWLSFRVLQQQGKGEGCLCCFGYWPYKVCSHMFPIWSPYAAHMFRSAHFQCENDHICPYVFPICSSSAHMLICFSLYVTICSTTYGPHTIWLFLKTLYIWATYGLHMGRIWASHMWPICGPYVLDAVVLVSWTTVIDKKKISAPNRKHRFKTHGGGGAMATFFRLTLNTL